VTGAKGSFLEPLRTARDFRLLFLATLGSSFGTWLALVALVVDVYDRTADATWVSAVLLAEFLPSIAVGLFAGPLIDRLPRRLVMVATDVARAGVFCLLPFAGGPAQIVALAGIAGVATSVFRPAMYSGLPNVVPDDELGRANGLLQTAENVTWAGGSVAGGALVAVWGPGLVYWVNAATFVVSALLIAGVRARLEEEREPSKGHWRDLAEGLRLVRGSRALFTVATTWSLALVGFACVNVAEVVLAKEVFDAGDFGYGLLAGATGVGLTLGSLVGGARLESRPLRLPYTLAITLMAAATLAAALAPGVWVAAAFVVAMGFGNGIALLCNMLLVQRAAPDRLRGRAFTVVMSIGSAFLGLGMIIAGPLTNALGARTVWLVSAMFLGLAAVAAFGLLGRSSESEEQPNLQTQPL
jgi:MFS family permease